MRWQQLGTRRGWEGGGGEAEDAPILQAAESEVSNSRSKTEATGHISSHMDLLLVSIKKYVYFKVRTFHTKVQISVCFLI